MQKSEMVDRATRNLTYMLMIVQDFLGPWAEQHTLDLSFITQNESNYLPDTYLTLEYSNNSESKVVHAGYVGQKLTAKEKAYTEKLNFITYTSLTRKPIFGVIMKQMAGIKEETELKATIANAIQTLVLEVVSMGNGVEAALATANGSIILFIKEATGTLVKLEFFLKDMVKFVTAIKTVNDEEVFKPLRTSIKNLLKPNQEHPNAI